MGGWPGSGKTTLSRALAVELGVPHLAKDLVKEALMDALGPPGDVESSRRLGRAAVHALLAAAAQCPGAVVDSTWFEYARPLVAVLPGPVVEVRCRVTLEVARERYRGRVRDPRHLDLLREDDELWGSEVAPLGLGPLLEVDTSGPVDVPAVAAAIRAMLVE
ncbi:AAA family ATPase [Nocardioides zeicaulis]